jgi:hypothetical protein
MQVIQGVLNLLEPTYAHQADRYCPSLATFRYVQDQRVQRMSAASLD